MITGRQLTALPLWSARWAQSSLTLEYQRNPRSFSRGFQMKPYDDAERTFPSFKTCFSPGVVVGEIARRGYPVFVGVDLSSDKRPGTCMFALAMDPVSRRRFPLEIALGAWTSPETAQRLADMNAKYNVKVIMVENNAYQQSILDWIRHTGTQGGMSANFWWKLEGFTTGKNKSSPEYGLPSLEVEFKNKAWVIPEAEFMGHDVTCRCGWCVWQREVVDFPAGATSDTVMAMWFAREALAKFGAMMPTGAELLGDFNAR